MHARGAMMHRRAKRLAALCLALSLVGCQAPDSPPSQPLEADAQSDLPDTPLDAVVDEQPPVCVDVESAFIQQVWPQVVGSDCATCHSPSGAADHTEFVLHNANGYPDHIQKNIESLRSMASVTIEGRSKLVLAVASDFGRTPHYNKDNGKDHWPVSSMLFMGAGIDGGRVIGATDEAQKKVLLDPQTLAPSPTGVSIRPEHVHFALRKHAGLDDTESSKRFKLKHQPLELFSAS